MNEFWMNNFIEWNVVISFRFGQCMEYFDDIQSFTAKHFYCFVMVSENLDCIRSDAFDQYLEYSAVIVIHVQGIPQIPFLRKVH